MIPGTKILLEDSGTRKESVNCPSTKSQEQFSHQPIEGYIFFLQNHCYPPLSPSAPFLRPRSEKFRSDLAQPDSIKAPFTCGQGDRREKGEGGEEKYRDRQIGGMGFAVPSEPLVVVVKPRNPIRSCKTASVGRFPKSHFPCIIGKSIAVILISLFCRRLI